MTCSISKKVFQQKICKYLSSEFEEKLLHKKFQQKLKTFIYHVDFINATLSKNVSMTHVKHYMIKGCMEHYDDTTQTHGPSFSLAACKK